jgi:hypothetical protein
MEAELSEMMEEKKHLSDQVGVLTAQLETQVDTIQEQDQKLAEVETRTLTLNENERRDAGLGKFHFFSPTHQCSACILSLDFHLIEIIQEAEDPMVRFGYIPVFMTCPDGCIHAAAQLELPLSAFKTTACRSMKACHIHLNLNWLCSLLQLTSSSRFFFDHTICARTHCFPCSVKNLTRSLMPNGRKLAPKWRKSTRATLQN